MENLFQKQLERERQSLIDGLNDHNRKINEMRGRCYFSGTDAGRKFRAQNLPLLRQALLKDFHELEKGVNKEKGAERHKAIRGFLKILVLMKEVRIDESLAQDEIINGSLSKFQQEKVIDELFSLLSHITLTAMLDQSMAFYGGYKDAKGKLRDPRDRSKKTCAEVERLIGQEFIFQTKLFLLSMVNPFMVDHLHEVAIHKGKAGKYNHHYNINRMLSLFSANSNLQYTNAQKGIFADGVTQEMVDRDYRLMQALHQFRKVANNADKFLGDWARSVLMNPVTGINAFHRAEVCLSVYGKDPSGYIDRKKRQTKFDMMFFPIPSLYTEWQKIYFDKDNLVNEAGELQDKDLLSYREKSPMLIAPQKITNSFVGGWLHDTEGSPGSDHKGSIEFSDAHLDFYNAQQEVGFKLNTWIFSIMEVLFKEDGDDPVKLGSFKPHKLQTPPTIFELAAKRGYKKDADFDEQSYEQQRSGLQFQIGLDGYNEVKRERAILWDAEMELIKEANRTHASFTQAKGLKDLERFFLPVSMDFRGRVVQRVFPVNYQGTDHCKSLLLFADGVEVDPEETKKWLLVQLANTWGEKLDKLPFSGRYSEMLKRQDKIIAVAEMMDHGRAAFELGMKVLREIKSKKGKPWQAAAACREYYECIIKKTKKETDLIVTIDGSSSGQQIASVWLKSKELATKTNVRNTDDGVPSDLYQVIADKLLVLMKVDGKAFSANTLKVLHQDGNLRTLVKSGFQAGQYAAGVAKQHESIQEKITELEKEGTSIFIHETPTGIDERELFCEYYSLALENVCQLGVLIDWFKNLCHLVHEDGNEYIKVPTPINTHLKIRYIPLTKRRTRTFSYGDTIEDSSKTVQFEPCKKKLTTLQENQRLSKWVTSLLPNVTHCCDAQLIALALNDIGIPFTTCHDSIGAHAGKNMNTLIHRLRQAMVELSKFDMFGELLDLNNIPRDYLPLPLQGDWDTVEEDIMDSDYMFS